MPFGISEFKSALDLHNGLQKVSLFSVILSLPTALFGPYSPVDMYYLNLLCFAGPIPNPTFQTIDNNRYGYGLTEKMPYNTVFNDATYVFLGDGEGYIHNFFRDWQRSTMEFSSENSMNRPAVLAPNIGNPSTLPYLMNYKDNYTATVNILSFSPTEIPIDLVTLNQAYPVNVMDVPLAWDQNDQFVVIPVTFTFRDTQYNYATRIVGLGNGAGIGTLPEIISSLSATINSAASFIQSNFF